MLQTRPYPKSRSLYPQDVLSKLKRFGIEAKDVHGKSLDEVKAIVKKKYHAIMLHRHPDTQAKRTHVQGGWYAGTKSIGQITDLYKELMALKEEDIQKGKRKEVTVYDGPNPWEILKMSTALPWGYQRDRDAILYQ